MVEPNSGAFAGFKQGETRVGPLNCLLINTDVEGTQHYGESTLENARDVYSQWVQANEGAARYDKKCAGSHIVVKYPVGTSLNAAGEEVDNATLASDIIKAMRSSGSVAIPSSATGVMAKLTGDGDSSLGWDVDFLDDGAAKQYSFVPRLEYLDKLMCRAAMMPERAILEGRFGTKAEAGAHQDIALTAVEQMDQHITRLFNRYVVDRFIVWNFGPGAKGSVSVKAAPLTDEALAWLREVYRSVLTNPVGFAEEAGSMDRDALRDAVGVTSSAEPGDPNVDEEVDEDQPVLDEISPT
jgi:hypothetical protein